MLYARARGGALQDQLREVEDACAFTIAGVEHAAGPRRLGEKGQCADDVFDINEIARLPSIAKNNERLSSHRAGDKYWNSRSIWTSGILARAEYIEEPDRTCLQPPLAAKKIAIILPVQLRDGIRTAGVGGQVFGFNLSGILAVDRCRTGKAKFFHSGTAGSLEDIEQAEDIESNGLHGFGHGFRHTDQGGQMENIIGPGNQLLHQVPVEDRSLDQAAIEPVQIGAVTCAEVVQHDDIGFALIVLDQMAPDETRPACDDDFHPATSRASFSMAAS